MGPRKRTIPSTAPRSWLDLHRKPSRTEVSSEAYAHPLILGCLGDPLPGDARHVEDQAIRRDLVLADLLHHAHDTVDVIGHMAQKVDVLGRTR
jgi:hypothetical protein